MFLSKSELENYYEHTDKSRKNKILVLTSSRQNDIMCLTRVAGSLLSMEYRRLSTKNFPAADATM